jgi:hypothetical protein
MDSFDFSQYPMVAILVIAAMGFWQAFQSLLKWQGEEGEKSRAWQAEQNGLLRSSLAECKQALADHSQTIADMTVAIHTITTRIEVHETAILAGRKDPTKPRGRTNE